MTREEIQYFAPEGNRPLRLLMAGISYCDGSYRITRPASMDLHVFEFVERGSGVLEVEGEFCHPQAGNVYYAPGGKSHSYRSDAQNPWVKHWFNLSGPLVPRLAELYLPENNYCFPEEFEAGKIIRDTVQELKKMDNEAAQDYMPLRLLMLVQALSKRRLGQEEPGVTEEASNLKSFLNTRVQNMMPSLEEMSRHTGLSQVQTIRIFRTAYGVTPYAFLLNRKMEAARELLCNSRRTVKEVALMLGFSDEYYFARLFKRKVGMAPGMYRKKSGGHS